MSESELIPIDVGPEDFHMLRFHVEAHTLEVERIYKELVAKGVDPEDYDEVQTLYERTNYLLRLLSRLS